MSLYNFNIDDIAIQHIEGLIEDGVYESKHIEYKRELELSKGRVEFLNDLTAMANGDGGDIIYGVETDKGNGFMGM